jgi:hypothetical protein
MRVIGAVICWPGIVRHHHVIVKGHLSPVNAVGSVLMNGIDMAISVVSGKRISRGIQDGTLTSWVSSLDE